jgi:hypothetical protein
MEDSVYADGVGNPGHTIQPADGEKAEHEGTSVTEIVLRGIDKELQTEPEAPKTAKRLRHPVIPSTRPGTLVISNEQIYDLIGFP